MNEDQRRRDARVIKFLLVLASVMALGHGGFYLVMRTSVVADGSLAAVAAQCSMWSAALLALLVALAYYRFTLRKSVVAVGLVASLLCGVLLYWALYGSLNLG